MAGVNKPNVWLDMVLASGLALAALFGYTGYLIVTMPVRVYRAARALWRME
jgi:hypothetical protein